MLGALNKLYDTPTFLIVAALCFVLFICIVKKPTRREEGEPAEAPASAELPRKSSPPVIGSVPLLPPFNPPLSLAPPAQAPAPTVINTIPLPELKRYVVLVEALLATFEQASVTVPGEYVETLLSTFTECDNISYSKPDEQGRVRMRFLPPGAFPDSFLVA